VEKEMTMNGIFDKLIILEMANNHMGSVEHGLNIIRTFHEIVKPFGFKCAIKFQYRDLDTFIHPDFKERTDIKYIKRFSETRLSEEDFLTMKAEMDRLGFVSVCTPFDEISVDRVVKHQYSILKIASCSFTDWPLLEKIAQTELPVIASTAGASIEDIDRVVSFFEHRNKAFCLMHCVGSYPTPQEDMELNQISFFKNRYPSIPVGYSTHEDPDNTDAVKIAVGKGACVFERHIGLPSDDYSINAYSSTPEQVKHWLEAITSAYTMCGVSGRRRDISAKENEDLRGLKRGVFASNKISANSEFHLADTFLAIPNVPDQLLANDMSKYSKFTALQDIKPGAAVTSDKFVILSNRNRILEIVRRLSSLLKESGIILQSKLDLELSHHHGIDQFERWGCSMINCINREYCKKIIMLLPGQENPCHTHKLKEETFHILYGNMDLTIDGVTTSYNSGALITVERGRPHSFFSKDGAVFEEISTTHYINDSFYDDQNIMENSNRKTKMTFWADWLGDDIQ
jgi:sialic acid synthase SpsE/mannose-6-phosphate isomerase-like protein (cupin superfamily)